MLMFVWMVLCPQTGLVRAGFGEKARADNLGDASLKMLLERENRDYEWHNLPSGVSLDLREDAAAVAFYSHPAFPVKAGQRVEIEIWHFDGTRSVIRQLGKKIVLLRPLPKN